MHLNIDGKSLTASKSALNDYKTAIEQLPDSEALKHDCLERAQQCRKDAEAEVAEHQQELARQQEVFAEMERETIQERTLQSIERLKDIKNNTGKIATKSGKWFGREEKKVTDLPKDFKKYYYKMQN